MFMNATGVCKEIDGRYVAYTNREWLRKEEPRREDLSVTMPLFISSLIISRKTLLP